MRIILFLVFFLLSYFCSGQKFYIKSNTQNNIHIRVWVDGQLINDHIMKKGDWLEIKSSKNGCWIWMKIIGDYCDPNAQIYNSTKFKVMNHDDGTYDIEVPQSSFSTFFTHRGISVENNPCPKKPQA